MDVSTFKDLAERHAKADAEYLVIPVYRRLSADLLTPVSAFLTLREPDTYAFLLESVEGGEKLGRYSFIGKEPYRVVQSRGDMVKVSERERSESEIKQGSIFEVLQEYLNRYTEVKVPDLPRLTSGAVGFLGYDNVRLIERLPDEPFGDLDMPDAVWCFYDRIIAFDHVKHQLIIVASAIVRPGDDPSRAYEEAAVRIDEIESVLRTASFERPEPVRLKSPEIRSNLTAGVFHSAVEQAKHYINEGDIFQVVLSQRFEMSFDGDRFNLYRSLRQVNPSPYLYYLDFGKFALVGSSPEVLVRVEQGRAELLPIAGTRPRGATHEEDRSLEADLLNDPKERAEHVMLVDLGRNDLGRVCTFDSVRVDRYAYIERYSHVMHIVSSVSGQLAADKGAMNVLAACFPAGTVSGAPKVRAMEIIDELEPTRRGVYAGAVGYVDFSGNLDTCIAIRTMVVVDDRIFVQAGAGIVADSDPQREFDETVNKARALKQAIHLAADGLL